MAALAQDLLSATASQRNVCSRSVESWQLVRKTGCPKAWRKESY